jgi:hypothetical protein
VTDIEEIEPDDAVEDVEPEDDIDPADLAAELDDEPPDDLADDEGEYDDEDLETYEGTARGGPIDGQTVVSRFPKGFLLVDMEQQQVWLYDRTDDGSFQARSNGPVAMQDDGDDNRWRAADEDEYDILVPDMEYGGDQ